MVGLLKIVKKIIRLIIGFQIFDGFKFSFIHFNVDGSRPDFYSFQCLLWFLVKFR
jgi:hypothetical protein